MTHSAGSFDALSTDRYRQLVEAIVDYAIYMLDPHGNVTSWNPGAQRFKGYAAHEIIGQHFSRFYTAQDRGTDLPARALSIAATEGHFEQEGWRVRKDGSLMWAHVVIDPVRSEDGTLVGYAKVTRDVTERHAAQQELEATRAHLIQSQKMEAVGQLTSGIAHDFNNLLAVVLGNLALAGKRLPPDRKLRQLIDNSIQAAERGATLTKRMLAFARRQELATGPVDVPNLVRGMAELLQRSISSNLPVNTQFPLNLPPALVDASQLELALLNLTVNARDAMPDGGSITVAARAARVAQSEIAGLEPGRYVCLSVTDTGTGMDAATLARAAEPFFTTKGIGKGTGLGLSMIHGFAEQSGGRLVLKSVLGQGTTVELWLPVATADLTVKEPAAVPELPALNAITVLVVDDDPLVLMNTAAMLEDLGHEVLEATSGEQALRILRRAGDSIDLVVTDQMMPGMTGTQLIDAIRVERAELPVILASGYAELPESKLVGLMRLTKPFEQIDLARALVGSLQPAGQVLSFRSKHG